MILITDIESHQRTYLMVSGVEICNMRQLPGAKQKIL